jgi:hypothetical protein
MFILTLHPIKDISKDLEISSSVKITDVAIGTVANRRLVNLTFWKKFSLID